jgi:chromosome segregation ATPase
MRGWGREETRGVNAHPFDLGQWRRPGIACKPNCPTKLTIMAWFDQKKQIDALRQDVDELKRQFRGLELEWTSVYDSTRRMLAKISRRQQREDASEDTQRAEGENGATSGIESSPSSLSARQQELNARILARRARLPQKGGE